MLFAINKIIILIPIIILIAIIIGALGFLLFRILMKTKIIRKGIESAQNRVDLCKENSVDSKIKKLENLSKMNEDFVEFYKTCNDTYVQLTAFECEEINSMIVIASNYINEKNDKEAASELKKINQRLENLEKNMRSLDEKIDAFFVKENECRDRVCTSKENFRKIKDSYNESYNELEICRPALESLLEGIDSSFLEIDTAINNGNYETALEKLEELNKEIEKLSKDIEILPKIVVKATILLPRKFQDLNERFNNMKANGFTLHHINFAQDKEKILPLFEHIKSDLELLNYEDKEDLCERINNRIEVLNDKLNQEEDAKKVFDEYESKFYHNAESLDNRYLKLKREMNEVNSLYLINDQYKEFFQSMEADINKMHLARRDLDTLKYSAIKQPYSLLTEKMTILAQNSEIFEKKLNEYVTYLQSLKNDSQIAYDVCVSFSIALNETKSRVLKTYHEFLISKYKEKFEEADEMLAKLFEIIHSRPINVEEANVLLEKIKFYIEKLIAEAEDDCTNHDIAENIIVFTNQYRSSFSMVADSLLVSEESFKNGEFEQTIETTTDILKQVNPNVYKKYMEQR